MHKDTGHSDKKQTDRQTEREHDKQTDLQSVRVKTGRKNDLQADNSKECFTGSQPASDRRKGDSEVVRQRYLTADRKKGDSEGVRQRYLTV